MKTFIFASVLAISFSPVAYAQSGSATDTNWITNLKCKDLVNTQDGSVNENNLPMFGVWVRGYMAGISSATKISLTSKVSASKFEATVLAVCSKSPQDRVITTSVDVASLLVNVLNGKAKRSVGLRDPGLPASD